MREKSYTSIVMMLSQGYDYPGLAGRGLDAARRYAAIAPSSPHALHMPWHIFTRLGLWQESVASNRDSAAASKEHRSVFEQLHALDYQAYGYLQGAQDREARRILDECQTLAKEDLEHFAREPNRFNGLYGAARAAELAGEAEKARTYYGKLVVLSAGSDTDRPALQQAKAFLAKK